MGDSLMGPDGPEGVFRSVADAEVSLDEMLSLACRQGKQDIVELLLESGAKVNYRNKAGNTPLLEACSQGHIAIARLLLERKADIDAPTETTSDSALTWACTLGNEDIVQLLLEHRASIEHRTRDGCTALMFAALAGHEKVAHLLLDHGAKLNVESDSNKDSPLTFACWKGHQKVVELFLSHKANIEHRTKEGFSPLMFAALGGHTEVAHLLLDKRAEINSPSGSNNDIPLTSACWKGHHAVVELLLKYNSNIEHHTKDGCTPLMLAAREGHLSVGQLLLNHSAKVNIPSGSENNIPLTLACWKGHRDVVELLLRYNSNIEHQNKAGCTPLMLAAREGHYEATELLLLHGAQLNMPSGSNDDTPLTLACWKGHEGVVSLLLDRQSSINHQTKTGCTPLMESTREGHVGVARMLLEAGADVETPDNYGQTPFFMACWKGHAEVASLLLDYGANKDCRTKTGITPFFQACRENHIQVVKLLLDYGCSPSSPFPNSRECPLTLAAEKGYVELTQVLISRNANIECRTKKGCTPFFLSCKEGYLEICVMLVKHGADTEANDQRGVTPLLIAFRNGHIEVVEWLLGLVAHLPSEFDCQKALMAPKPSDKDIFPLRSKCYELIMKAKKAREQAALKNAQILFEELDAEKEKKETKRKAAARKKIRRKEKKKKEQAEKVPEDEIEPTKDYDEEEGLEVIGPHLQPAPPQTIENFEQVESPGLLRKRSRRSRKKVVPTLEVQSMGTSSSVTAATRTSLQTPAHMVTDSWEEEESGDEMFVDAPSEFLPDNVSLCSQGSGRDVEGVELGGGDKGGRGSKDGGDKKKLAKSSSVKGQKAKVNGREGANAGGGVKRTGSIKGNKGGADRPASAEGLSPKSPNERKKKTNNNMTSKSPDPDRKSIINTRTSPLFNQQEEEEVWDDELEPTSEWNNVNFESSTSRQISRTKSWVVVATVATTTTAVSTTTTSTVASTNSKNWQEVSRAIKTHQLTVSNSLVGRIIGRKGLKINQIQAESGAQISISRAIPRSVDRLVTIKGTERSVNTARELIEEALSTSNKDSEETVTSVCTVTTQALSTSAGGTSSTACGSVPVVTTNAWLPSSQPAWGGGVKSKRHSDVSPPSVTSLDEPVGRVFERRVSLPVGITSSHVAVTSSTPPIAANPTNQIVETSKVATTTASCNGPTSSVMSSLTSLKEVEEPESVKHKRSLSDPMTTPITPPTTTNHSTMSLNFTSRYSPTMSPIMFSPSETSSNTFVSSTITSTSPSLVDPSISSSSSSDTPITAPPTTASTTINKSIRMVGVVAPTQAVKPYQHETVSTTPTVSVYSTDNGGSGGRGNFGAIGPPNRRNSLPVSVAANHLDMNMYNPRKLSYAGIPVVPALGVVHETVQTVPPKEYWPPFNNTMPHPPHHHAPPMYAPPNPNHMDWNEYTDYERGRSFSWAGLPPGGNFGPPNNEFPPLGGPANRPYHMMDGSNHLPDHMPPPPVHSHSWGKYPAPPMRSSLPFRPQHFPNHYLPQHQQQHYRAGNHGNNTAHWGAPPTNYPHHKIQPISKQPNDSTLPLSLRQVLGEKLEQEIFTGEGEIDDSPSKRWSVSSFPPNITESSTISSSWAPPTIGTTHSPISSRHSIAVSPFYQPGSSDTVISDLAASWPIWTTPISSSAQSQSPFSPAGSLSSSRLSLTTEETSWSFPVNGTSSQSELVDLMKSLDIAEHIPALKTRKLSLDQLVKLTEEEWRELNLPVGPRVKLMNAIYNSSGRLNERIPSGMVVNKHNSTVSDGFCNSSHELNLTPPTSYVN